MGAFDDAVAEFADEYDPPVETLTGAIGTVQTVTAGAAADGRALVVVNVEGTNVAAYCNYDYAPAAGHVVLVQLLRNVPIIVCRLGSFPPVT